VPLSDNSIIDSYIQAILREIDFLTESHEKMAVDTVYFGGGTPSLLHPEQVMKILNFIRERFILETDSEITIEMNPNDLHHDKLKGYIDAGINRIVLGVQSLNNEMRKNIGRSGDNIDPAGIELFFSFGEYIKCIDIMAGLPGENKSILLNDLETITNYMPEHISLYLLSIDEGTALAKRFIPDNDFENLQTDLWGIAMDYLIGKEYNHYEISNYALPGFESRHNSKYWSFTPYYGFGSGAHSYMNGIRYSNNMSIFDYIECGCRGDRPDRPFPKMNRHEFLNSTVGAAVCRPHPNNIRPHSNCIRPMFKYDIDASDNNSRIVEFIMTTLRRKIGFSADEFKSVTSMAIPGPIISELDRLISEDMIILDDGRYFLSKKGIFFADSIIYRLTEKYL
jgi:oxygen-independent coproporphyrinogen-3 oxidase